MNISNTLNTNDLSKELTSAGRRDWPAQRACHYFDWASLRMLLLWALKAGPVAVSASGRARCQQQDRLLVGLGLVLAGEEQVQQRNVAQDGSFVATGRAQGLGKAGQHDRLPNLAT